jgi:signal peptidase II
MSKGKFVAVVAVSVLIVDQLTKWWIRSTVPLYHSFPVIDSLFHITHVRNSGGAFSLLAGSSDAVRIPFFLIASMVAIGVLVYFLRQVSERQRWLLFALAGVLGGALGNLIDRVTIGQVTDFLDLHWRGYHWPAFNVADSFISIGVAILVAHSIFARKSDPES